MSCLYRDAGRQDAWLSLGRVYMLQVSSGLWLNQHSILVKCVPNIQSRKAKFNLSTKIQAARAGLGKKKQTEI